MEINYSILEEIRQYLAGELPDKEAAALEQKIRSDEQYAFHYQSFRAAERGIRKKRISELETELAAAETEEGVDPEPVARILRMDRVRTHRRITGALVSAAAVIVLLIIGWNQLRLGSADSPQGPAIVDVPGEEGEIVPGSPGVEPLKVPIQVFSVQGETIAAPEETGELRIIESSTAALSYTLKDSSLILFTDDPTSLKTADIQWLKVERDGAWGHFLKIGEDIYSLKPSKEKTPLAKAPPESLPEYLK